LTDEGNQIADNGSHEAAVFNVIPSEGIALDELMVRQLVLLLTNFKLSLSFFRVDLIKWVKGH